ncbi:folate-binding protein YgfZ [Candidatus Liberibacter africanus]|uniref:Aminomethyltransferase protein (Glycine cleavage) n=1 Tax=Candidatus Liberibacter africanus PTSAPSY TaxID=1277257 RepID=A0A0G3I355_LIBAF|nr:folate-binding protein YgfZ [Candidatus Liberibacter africanus]AKK20316.1 aminomethyltransferase protein (glycine cleavage) [Candidatus Liberibacter africanus PTSAPSY]QTP64068.1 folate-binding protein YgfZ [Candidatus Liberibacter africanus]
MTSVYLSERSFVKVSGNSSVSFLQGIITADITSLPLKISRGSALLTPQGKILFYFLISKVEENVFMLETDMNQCDSLMERLLFYKLRSNVTIETQSTDGVTLFWNQEHNSNNLSFVDERFSIANVLLHRTLGHNNNATSDIKTYNELRITYGIVDPDTDFLSSTIFPHDASMDLIKGISFTKGCYIGQEVVSRMQHRNIIRRRPTIITGSDALPPRGSSLIADNIKIGTLGVVVGKKALAIARIDKINNAMVKSMELTINGIKVRSTFPQWLK